MIVINSTWEKTNLGVTSKEIVVESVDDIEEFSGAISDVEEQYIVLKIPAGEVELMRIAQTSGYCFVEALIEVEHDLHEIERGKVLQRLYDAMDYRLMESDDIRMMLDEVSKGLFSSDRISNDPEFSSDLSANRYTNWIRTLLDEGALPYVMFYKGEPAGFIILTTEDKESYYSVLGGGYERFRKTGLGMVQKEQEIVKKLGGRRLTTKVSSNNGNQLKALLANGYTYVRMEYVFVKHNK